MALVPIFRLGFDAEFRQKYQSELGRIFDEGFLSNHTFVRRFENEFAQWSHHPFCVATASGTQALEMIFRAMDVRGKEVIVPANTFIATAAAVRNAGGTVVVADIDPRFLSLDPAQVAKKMSPRTAAVVVVHVGGMISDQMFALQSLCRETGVPLIEDCAHAHGASLHGVKAGSFGLAGAFSFHLTKVMTTGEGGAVVTKDPAFHELLISCRQFGVRKDDPLVHVRDGSNGKMTEMQALMGVLELSRVDERIQKRQKIAAHYQARLQGSVWRPFVPPENSVCSYYKQILASPMDDRIVRTQMEERGVKLTGGVYHVPLHRQPVLHQDPSDHPVSEHFSRHHICPPCYPELEIAEVDYVCDQLLQLKVPS